MESKTEILFICPSVEVGYTNSDLVVEHDIITPADVVFAAGETKLVNFCIRVRGFDTESCEYMTNLLITMKSSLTTGTPLIMNNAPINISMDGTDVHISLTNRSNAEYTLPALSTHFTIYCYRYCSFRARVVDSDHISMQ